MKNLLALTIVAIAIYQYNCCVVDTIKGLHKCADISTTYSSAIETSSGLKFTLSLSNPSNGKVSGTILTTKASGTFGIGLTDGNFTSGVTVEIKGSSSYNATFFSNRNETWSVECVQEVLGKASILFRIPICNNGTLSYSRNTVLFINDNGKNETIDRSKFDGINKIIEAGKCN